MIKYIFIFPILAFGQMEFFGYYETEYDHLQLKGTNYNFGYNKLRIDLESRSNENIMIAANINFRLYHGKTNWDFSDFIPEYLGIDSVLFTLPDTMYLDNIYIRSSFPLFDFTIGKQPISLGTGYAWNPLDIFNRKDLLNPTYEQPGINALRMEIPIVDRTVLDAIITPDSSLKMSRKMIQLKSGFGSFDISLNAVVQYHLIPNGEDSYTYDQVYFGGSSFVGELWEFGLWGETLWSLDADNNFGEVVLGVDHTLNNGIYLMAEYFHNSLGAEKDDLRFEHFMHYYNGETHSLMQNYIFAMGMYNITAYISSSLLAFGNLDDQSFILAPQIEWDAFEDVTASILMSQSFGDDDTEFGIQDFALRFRLRAYF